MYKRILIVGLFALSLVLLLWRVEAEAGCSCIKYFGGSCLTNCGTMQPKGLLSSLSGLTTGPGTKFVTVGAEGLCPGLSSIPGGTCDTTREDASILFSCVNNGGNFSQGNQAVTASATMTGASQITRIDGKGKFKNLSVTSLVQTTPQLDAMCQDLGGQTWRFFDGAFCDSDPDPAHPGAPGVFEVVGNIVLSDESTVDASCASFVRSLAVTSTTSRRRVPSRALIMLVRSVRRSDRTGTAASAHWPGVRRIARRFLLHDGQ